VRRRNFTAALLLGTALGTSALAPRARAHTPYRQWQVYRRKHLLIGCHKEDMAGYALAKEAVAILDEHLPAARARVARGPTPGRLASLLGTEQMDVALLGEADAAAMVEGRGRFAPYGAIELRTLLVAPGRVLVARADFPERHAWLVSDALDGWPAGVVPDAPALPVLPWHPGAERRRQGRPVPAADASG